MNSDPSAVQSKNDYEQWTDDAGCGHDGPGLWVAALTGARLIGIDPTKRRWPPPGAGPTRPGWPASQLPPGTFHRHRAARRLGPGGDEHRRPDVRAQQACRRRRAGPDPHPGRAAGADQLGLPQPARRPRVPDHRSPAPAGPGGRRGAGCAPPAPAPPGCGTCYELGEEKLFGHIKPRKNRARFLEFCRYLRSLYLLQVRITIVCDSYSPHLTTRKDKRAGQRAAASNTEIACTPTNSSWWSPGPT